MTDNLPPLPEPARTETALQNTRDRHRVVWYSAHQMQAYARAAIEKDRERQSVPDSLSDYELSELAHSANQEALSFGLGYDVFMRYFKVVRDKALAAPPQPQPVQKPVLKIYKGDICYKSKDDDQSYGMWCPVTYDHQHGLPDGTQFYTSPQAAQPLSDEQIAQACDKVQCIIATARTTREIARAIELAHGITKGTT